MDIGQLYEEHRRPLFLWVLKKTADWELAEDLVQLTFAKLVRSSGTYQDQGLSPRAWLFTVIRNLLVDHWRHVNSSTGTHLDLSAERLVESGREVGAPLAELEEPAIDLSPYLARLTDAQRQAIELFYYHGYSEREVAAELGVSEEAVKKLKARARVQLRRMIERKAA